MSHWYLPDGTPMYRVPYAGKREGMRDATIRDARKVGAYPSVTAIIDTLAKPGLVNWQIEQGIMAALTNPNVKPDMSIREIMRLLKADAAEQVKDAADRGTAIHDLIEAAYKTGTIPGDWYDYVWPVLDMIDQECGLHEWKAEKWFASPLGYGGKIDLISDEWVLDIKTKEGDVSDIKAWPEQCMQLVAYDVGCPPSRSYHMIQPEKCEPERRLANVFVSRDIPGSVKFIEWTDRDEIRKQWRIFKHLLGVWHEQKDYFPHLAD